MAIQVLRTVQYSAVVVKSWWLNEEDGDKHWCFSALGAPPPHKPPQPSSCVTRIHDLSVGKVHADAEAAGACNEWLLVQMFKIGLKRDREKKRETVISL